MNPGARCGADRLCLERSESRNRLSDTLAWPVFVARPVRRWRMKYTKRTFLPALALGFSACAEHPEVVAPNAQLRSDLRHHPRWLSSIAISGRAWHLTQTRLMDGRSTASWVPASDSRPLRSSLRLRLTTHSAPTRSRSCC